MPTKGLIQIYTGEGKGKTTAAVGLACRALGHNLKVYYISFHKQMKGCGCAEHRVLKKLGAEIYGFAQKHPRFNKGADKEDIRKRCLWGLEFIGAVYRRDGPDILILDEILIALRDGFLREEEVMGILDSKPERLELILTGRGATEKLIQKADLVSEIKKIKHPYDSGVKRRKGIEY